MSGPAVCILYTQAADFTRRVKAFLRVLAEVRHVSAPDRVDAVLQQASPAVLLMDLRAKDARALLAQIEKEWPDVLVIALGTPRSEPLREAEQAGIYAAEDLGLDRRRFQALVSRAFDHLRLLQENRDLRESTSLVPVMESPRRVELTPERSAASLPLLRFPRVFRRFENVETLLASVMEGVADAASVTRVGMFARIRPGDRYRLRAGLRCLPETYEVEYGERDPLVRWFELHAHLICRTNLPQATDQSQRALMRRALDTFGAEVIVPLHARGRINGWLFFGHRLTGQRFDYQDLENLMVLAEHVSNVLENALLHEEITVQKTLAETLLKAIPPGIVATDEEAIVRWFNPTAEQILGLTSADVLNRPVEAVGGRLAGFLRDALDAPAVLPARRWIDSKTHRSVMVETRRLSNERAPVGAVAVVHDLTTQENLREKQDLVERAVFWADLAASMSHEIRNPLVAIKTFAQLLPERFDDADFRKEFNGIVVQEIDRLDKIMLQINNFAHPTGARDEADRSADVDEERDRDGAREVREQWNAGGNELAGRFATCRRRCRRVDGSLCAPGGERDGGDPRSNPPAHQPRRQAAAHEWHDRRGRYDPGQRQRHRSRAKGQDLLALLHHKGAGDGARPTDCEADRVRSQRPARH